MEVSIDHADIVVTHKCTFNCKYCKLINSI